MALGAFAAHGLKATLTAEDLAGFETGVRYQVYHGIGLLACGALPGPAKGRGTAAHCFLWGTVLFSGSLYLLTALALRWLGAVTPAGGVLFLAGWLALALAAHRRAS